MAKVGRKTKYNIKLATEICAEIVAGRSVKTVAEKLDIEMSTIFRWRHEHEEFKELYARAKQDQADTFAEELLQIVDDARNDFMIDQNGNRVVDKEHVQRSKLRYEARRWLMSKYKPKFYGDKITNEVTGEDGGAVQTNIQVHFVKPKES